MIAYKIINCGFLGFEDFENLKNLKNLTCIFLPKGSAKVAKYRHAFTLYTLHLLRCFFVIPSLSLRSGNGVVTVLQGYCMNP